MVARRSRARTIRLACLLAPAFAASCGTAVAPSFEDPTPEARIGAIRKAASAPGPAPTEDLVENLSSDDAAVRLAAIGALRRTTGETLGYRFDAPRAEREEAVARWKSRLAANKETR